MSLNPNAPLFVPAALRQVEDFSPEWWDLVTTSPWFHNYWLSQHQEDDGSYGSDDIADLLPETFDINAGEEFDSMEAQFEEFIRFSELESEKPKNEYGIRTEALIQNMRYLEAKSPKFLQDRPNYIDKPSKNTSAKYSPRRIQQPR